MTSIQLYNACSEHRYIAIRQSNGKAFGVNTKIALLGMRRHNFKVDDTETNVKGFFPINFHEYISSKKGII